MRRAWGIGRKSVSGRRLSIAGGSAIAIAIATLPMVGIGIGGDGQSPQAHHGGTAGPVAEPREEARRYAQTPAAETPASEPSAAKSSITVSASEMAKRAGTGDEGAGDEGAGDEGAGELLDHCIRRLALGAAFDAKLRQRVWANGREVVGVGSYEQAGEGTGQFHLQLTMHDGDGKHTIRQISDGKLAWTRTDIAHQVTLKRVNLGALDVNPGGETKWPGLQTRGPKAAEFRQAWKNLVEPPEKSGSGPASGGPRVADPLPVKAMVGGLVELLHQAGRDFDLRATGGKLAGEPVWILAGPIREAAMMRAKSAGGLGEKAGLPVRYPTRIRVAIASRQGRRADFATGIPLRFEYWHDASGSAPDRKPVEDHGRPAGQLISLVEVYSIQEITRPSPARFRFVNDEHAIHFVDETEYYRDSFGRAGG